MKKILILLIALLITTFSAKAELSDSCKLEIGTNLGGISDWGTEIPFVNMMKSSRTWYSKNAENPREVWNTEKAHLLKYRYDGYPTHIPQDIGIEVSAQIVATIWAVTDGWSSGEYTVLYEGTGEINFRWVDNPIKHNENRITFEVNNPIDGTIEMIISESDINDPVRNIQIVLTDYVTLNKEQVFNPAWLDILKPFKTVRFMDWGKTNNWGGRTADDTTLFTWEERSGIDFYTWTGSKGIPYEMMIKLMNEYDKDGWVCVPHNVSDDYIRKMAELFHEQLNPDRKLYVELSNEIWNWMFTQTNFYNIHGCENKGVSWPEGIVPYIQNCMDIWSDVFEGDLERISRVVGVQGSWQDVSNRTVFNMRQGSFDAVSPTFYFGFSNDSDAALDALGEDATVEDVIFYARKDMPNALSYLQSQKESIIDSLGVEFVFYEGGQHITGHPFGEEPTWAEALLASHRDTAMYNLYNEWFDMLRTLQEGDEPLKLMNFSFVGGRSARYGSWGILETMTQDTSIIPAPKYKAVLENMNRSCEISAVERQLLDIDSPIFYPNPSSGEVKYQIQKGEKVGSLFVMDYLGRVLYENNSINGDFVIIDVCDYSTGVYFVVMFDDNEQYLKTGKINVR